MLVKIADKQVITGPAPGPSIIYTDPIELGEFNRAFAVLVAHALGQVVDIAGVTDGVLKQLPVAQCASVVETLDAMVAEGRYNLDVWVST